ncbi:MAG: substrate-binding domain-containing protein [Nitrospirota bacterium]|nr:substrate-binding domain-containing protein [Nitrospirota bacterium]
MTVASFAVLMLLPDGRKPYLIFLSGAAMKVPVAEIAGKFEEKTGIRVLTVFEGSLTLRNYILNFMTGDVFLPGDRKVLDGLSEKGLLRENSFVAWHKAGILVSPRYKGEISGLDDLSRKGVRLAISNPEMTSLGKLINKRILGRHPKGREILSNVVFFGSSTQEILRKCREGNIDAVIEWEVMAYAPEGKGLLVVPIEKEYSIKDALYIGLLTTSRHPELAKRFYDFFAQEGKEIFNKHGYDVKGAGV